MQPLKVWSANESESNARDYVMSDVGEAALHDAKKYNPQIQPYEDIEMYVRTPFGQKVNVSVSLVPTMTVTDIKTI